MIHTIITCDRCNEDGEYDAGWAEYDGTASVFLGDADGARGLGWKIGHDETGDPDYEHVCAGCIADDQTGDEP